MRFCFQMIGHNIKHSLYSGGEGNKKNQDKEFKRRPYFNTINLCLQPPSVTEWIPICQKSHVKETNHGVETPFPKSKKKFQQLCTSSRDNISPWIKRNFYLFPLLLDTHDRCIKLHGTIIDVKKLQWTY